MEQKPTKLDPSTLQENNDLEQRLENILNAFHSFGNRINNLKKMITRFKVKIHKSKNKQKKCKLLTTKNHLIQL